MLFKQATPTLLLGLGVATILTTVLWSQTDRVWLSTWISLLVVVTVLRVALVSAFFRLLPTNLKRWETFYAVGAAIGGTVWGAAGWLLEVTPSLLYQVLIMVALAGNTAGAIASNAASYRTYLVFLVPTLAPLAVWELQSGQPTGVAIAAMVMLFACLLAVTALNYHRNLIESLRIRRENLLLSTEIRLAASVFDNSLQGVIITDIEERIVKINPAVTEITGYSASDANGTPLRQWLSDEDDVTFRQTVTTAIDSTGKWEGETWYRRKNGEVFPVWQSITTVTNQRGEPARRIVIFGDISERKRAEDKIRRIAYQDALTNLPNRRVFEDRLGHAIERAKRHGIRFAVLFVDLYNFRSINDSLGYQAGDQLLRATAQRLQQRVRQEDTVARIDADKFGLIIEAIITAGDAETVAQNAVAALKSPLNLRAGEINPACSIGIAICPQDGLDAGALIGNVDTALNQAVKQGENCYRFYSTTMSLEAAERLSMEWALRRAIERNELVLYYQPQYSLALGRVVGAEALVRWQHPERGLLPPGDFIFLAEETKLIHPLSRWVLRRAVRDWRELAQNRKQPLRLSVNVSGHQFSQPDFVPSVAGELRDGGIPPEQLELEITESVLIHDARAATAILQQLKDLGVRIAMDDFGTGYSSLSYLATLPIDTVKIDRAFISGLGTNKSNMALVKAVLQMCEALKLEVVAEGVETEAEALALQELGGDIFQGYLFSRPVAKELFSEKIASTRLNLVAG